MSLSKKGHYIFPELWGHKKGSIHYYDGADSANPKLEIVNFTWSGGWPTIAY